VRFSFTYDGNDRLIAITDADDQVTTMERGAGGIPTAIVASTGQRTTLTIDADGYLGGISNPAGEAVQLTYYTGAAEGLLSTLTNALGKVHSFDYDAVGRLAHDVSPSGGVSTLARTDVTDDRYTVTITSAIGLQTIYDVENLPTGETRRIRVDPSGGSTETLVRVDGSRRVTHRDGTVVDLVLGPDPRWGLQAPIDAVVTSTSPGGLIRTTTASRTVALADPSDKLSLVSQTDTGTINGATYSSIYDAATRTFTVTTPADRHGTTTLDPTGRPTVIGSRP
jgi:YD repeat-containing protein